MRQIKFRAVIAGTDTWIYGLPCSVYSENGIDAIQDLENKQIEYIKTDTLSQFTGSTDKNGKEIYEGDFDSEETIMCWCDDCHGWTFGQIDFISCHFCEGNFHINDHINNFEIAGNIYQNRKIL